MLNPRGLMKKANLNFAAKFFWLLVLHRLSPTVADNVLTYNRAELVVALVEGLSIDFAKILIIVIHERDFKSSATFPFACLIFHLCRDVGVPIWICDTLHTTGGTVHIDLIMDEANVAAPRRGPRGELQPLSENFANTVVLSPKDDVATSEPCDTT